MTNHKDYQSLYDLSLINPEAFWGEAAKGIHWYKPPTKILDDSRKPFYLLPKIHENS